MTAVATDTRSPPGGCHRVRTHGRQTRDRSRQRRRRRPASPAAGQRSNHRRRGAAGFRGRGRGRATGFKPNSWMSLIGDALPPTARAALSALLTKERQRMTSVSGDRSGPRRVARRDVTGDGSPASLFRAVTSIKASLWRRVRRGWPGSAGSPVPQGRRSFCATGRPVRRRPLHHTGGGRDRPHGVRRPPRVGRTVGRLADNRTAAPRTHRIRPVAAYAEPGGSVPSGRAGKAGARAVPVDGIRSIASGRTSRRHHRAGSPARRRTGRPAVARKTRGCCRDTAQRQTRRGFFWRSRDAIAWLLNVCGGDVPYTPLPLAFRRAACGRPGRLFDRRQADRRRARAPRRRCRDSTAASARRHAEFDWQRHARRCESIPIACRAGWLAARLPLARWLPRRPTLLVFPRRRSGT